MTSWREIHGKQATLRLRLLVMFACPAFKHGYVHIVFLQCKMNGWLNRRRCTETSRGPASLPFSRRNIQLGNGYICLAAFGTRTPLLAFCSFAPGSVPKCLPGLGKCRISFGRLPTLVFCSSRRRSSQFTSLTSAMAYILPKRQKSFAVLPAYFFVWDALRDHIHCLFISCVPVAFPKSLRPLDVCQMLTDVQHVLAKMLAGLQQSGRYYGTCVLHTSPSTSRNDNKRGLQRTVSTH